MNLFILFTIALLCLTTVAQYVWDATKLVEAAASDEFFQVPSQSLMSRGSLQTGRPTPNAETMPCVLCVVRIMRQGYKFTTME
jgi:hypothetical protein